MKREFLTPSNLLSVTRALLIIPFALVMLLPDQPLRWWGAAIVILAMATDKFDGVLARKYHQETELGRILDPLADKIGVAAVALVLLRLRDIPSWFVTALIARYLLIFCGGLYAKLKHGVVLASNAAGKWTVGVIGVTFLFRLAGIVPEFTDWLIDLSAAMLLVSLLVYCGRFVKFLRSPREEGVHGTP